MGALGRTASRPKAAFALVFFALVTLAVLAPQDARAQEKPALTATAGVGSVTLNWTRTGNTGFGYWVYRQGVTGGGYGDWIDIPGGVTIRTHTVTGLTAGTSYTFQVARAEGTGLNFSVFASGGGYSNGASATPTAATTTTVPAAPTNLTATGAGTTQALLTWTKPAGTITGYKLRYAKTPAKGSATWAAMAGSGANTVRHMVTGLEDDAEYSFMIRAVNASGDGAATGWVTATPMDSCPSVLSPTNLSLAPRSDGFVVTWTAPTDVFRNGWTLSYGKTGGSSTSVTISNAAATSRTLTGLDANTEYEISLTATHSTYNPSAVCPPGFRVKATGTTGAAVAKPAAPTGLSAEAGNAQVKLTWTDPDDDSITRYQLRQKKGSAAWGSWTAIPGSDADTTTHTVTGLDNDVEYSFRIRARNSGGNSAQSAVVEATPSASAAVPKPVLSAEAGYARVTLSWSALSGVTVASWGYQYKPAGGSWSTTTTVTGGSATSATVTGLTIGTEYTFRLFAAVSLGVQSVWSDEVKATPTNTVPKPVLTAAAGDRSVTLSWSALSGIPITSWGYQYKSSGGWSTTTTVTGGSTTSATVTGLTGGTEHTFRLFAAVSPGVQSVWSDEVKATPYALAAPVLTGATSNAPSLVLGVGLTWTHSGDLLPSGATWWYWQMGHRLRGSTDWRGTARTGASAVLSARTVNWGLDTFYPEGAVVEVRIRGRGINDRNGLWSNIRTVTLSDDDDDRPALTIAGAPVTVEPGSAATYTVALTKAYAGTLRVASDDTSAATVSPPSLTFTTSNYNTARTVTVTGVGNGTATIDHAFRLTGASADAIPDAGTVDVTVADAPGVTVSTAALTVAEGGSGNYTMRLNAVPSSDVTITVAGASGDVTVMGSPLTFTTSNWNMPQTVTVNAAEDGDTTTDPDVTLTHSASGGGYGSVSIASVVVSVTEKDVPPAAPSGLAAAAGDGSATLSWTDPNNPTIAKWQYRQQAGGGAWGAWMDIPGSGAGTTSYEVSGLDNGVAYQFEVRAANTAGEGTVVFGLAASATATPQVPRTASYTPRRGRATVTPTALTVAEGGSGSYAVVLGARPSSEVTVAISGASGDVSVSPPQLVFTRSNWEEPQTVTVTAAEDDDAEADPTVTLSHAASGGGYGSVSIDDVEVTVTENDARGATLSTAALTVPEGGSAEYAATLDAQPSGEVSVAISGASGDVTVSPSRLVFTSANWNKPQTVTVSAAEDDDAEADPTVTLSHAASGGGYGAVSIGDVEVTVTENDARGATLSADALTVPEGGSAEYAATLDSQPSGEVTVAISGASGDVTVSPSRLVFTPANWSEPQTVAVLAAEDDDAEADPATRLSHAASGGGYGSVSIGDVEVTVTENDARGATLSTDALTVPEGGTAEYALTLDSQPSGEVAIEVSGASGDVTASPSRLIFTRSNWSEPQTVTVSAAEDDDADPDPAITLSHKASGGGYDAVAVGAVAVTATENDTRGATLSKDALTLPEGGSGAYALTLDSQPSGEVAIEVSGASGDVTVSPSRLIFTGANWNEPQTVTVSAARDDDAEADPSVTLSHGAAGGGYDAVAIGSVRVSVTENYSAAREAARKRDAVNRAVLPQVLAALGSSSAVKERVEAGGISGAAGASSASGAAARFGAFLQSFAGRGNVSGLGAGPAAGAFPGSGVDLRAWTADPRAAARSGLGGGRLFAGAAAVSGPNAAGSHPGGPLGGPLGSGGSLGSGSAGWGPGGSVGWSSVGAGGSVGPAGSSSVGPAGAAGSVPPGSTPPGAARGPRSPERSALSRLGESLFAGAGFALPLAAGGGSDLASTATVWGRGEQTSFSGSEAGARWDGRLWTAHLGADFRARPDVLVGAAVSHSRSETDVGAGFESVYETELTSLSPYAAWLLADGSNLWASASYGAGEARVALRDAASRSANLAASPAADLTAARAEAGGRRVLAALPDWIAGGVTRFSVKGEGSLSRATTGAELGLGELTVDASRLRLALEGSHERTLAGGGVLEPAVEAGLRYDGGDVAAGAGLEIGASLGWRDPGAGLTAEFRGRALATHERDRDEWGLSALLRIDPSADGLGGFLTLAPSWGAAETGIARLFDAAPASAFANGGAPLPPRARMEAEYGYGFGVARRGALAVLSPYARLGLGEAGERSLRFGAKYLLESAFSFEFELERREDELLAPAQRFMLRGEYRW